MMAILVHSSLTSSTMCVERRTTLFSPSSLSRFKNRTRSAGSIPAVGSSTISSFGWLELPRPRRTAASCLQSSHPASVYGHPTGSFAGAVPPRLVYALDAGYALEDGEVFQQVLGVHLRVNAKLLRQVTKRLAYFSLLLQHVYRAELNAAS